MVWAWLIAFALGLSASSVVANPSENGVYSLDFRSFEAFTAVNTWVILFHSSDEPAEALEDEIEEMGRQLHNSGAYVAKVDASVEHQIADQYKVKDLPTIIIRRGAEHQTYTGSIQADEVVVWALGAKDELNARRKAADAAQPTQKKRAQHSSQGSASSDDWLKHELLSLLEDASQLRRPSFQDVMLQLRATAANAEVFMRQNLVVVISLVWALAFIQGCGSGILFGIFDKRPLGYTVEHPAIRR